MLEKRLQRWGKSDSLDGVKGEEGLPKGRTRAGRGIDIK